MGVTFCAVAPEHPLAQHAAKHDPKVAAFIERCMQGGTTEAEHATRDKEGVPTGLTVTHPLTEEPIPLWVGNYVLMAYGDGAVMGVPGHDERDFEFALKYHLPILQVIHIDGEHYDYHRWQDWYADKTRGVTINSDLYSGFDHPHAVNAVAKALGSHGLGEKKTTWRLRDWSISRQRYWGTPIPIVHCDACGVVPVPEKDLPVVLPEDLVPDGSGSPLAKCESFLKVACPKCGAPARRETDTMDTFVDSAWYYMRYCSAGAETMVDARNDYWMPMDQYIGGIEHAVLHLLYARFWTKVMRDMGMLRFDEPFERLMNHGMLLNHIYFTRGDKGGKDYVPPSEVKPVLDAQGRITGGTRADGTPVEYGGVGKMGKTERNGVDPQALIDQYGADTARLFVMFVGGPEDASVWSDTGVEGSSRFLRRLWNFAARQADAVRAARNADAAPADDGARALRRDLHGVLKQVLYDYERMQYNTVVSGAMKLLNALEAQPSNATVVREGLSMLLRVLYPACPHITEVLWRELGFEAGLGPLLDAPMPTVDESALEQDQIELVLQVNGKLRGKVIVPAGADDKHIEQAAIASPEFAKFAGGRSPRFVKIVKGRLVNLVV
jgi:leucyl-tRNA synthetase